MSDTNKANLHVYKGLQAVRVGLTKLSLKKSGYNSYTKYYYFELQDFLPAAMELMFKESITSVVSYDPEPHITVTSFLDGSTISIKLPNSGVELKGAHEVQNTGAAVSYFRRYLYLLLLEITESDELDAKTNAPEEAPKKPAIAAVGKWIIRTQKSSTPLNIAAAFKVYIELTKTQEELGDVYTSNKDLYLGLTGDEKESVDQAFKAQKASLV